MSPYGLSSASHGPQGWDWYRRDTRQRYYNKKRHTARVLAAGAQAPATVDVYGGAGGAGCCAAKRPNCARMLLLQHEHIKSKQPTLTCHIARASSSQG